MIYCQLTGRNKKVGTFSCRRRRRILSSRSVLLVKILCSNAFSIFLIATRLASGSEIDLSLAATTRPYAPWPTTKNRERNVRICFGRKNQSLSAPPCARDDRVYGVCRKRRGVIHTRINNFVFALDFEPWPIHHERFQCRRFISVFGVVRRDARRNFSRCLFLFLVLVLFVVHLNSF